VSTEQANQCNTSHHIHQPNSIWVGSVAWHSVVCVGTLSWQQPDSSMRPNKHFLAPFSTPVPICNISSERVPFDLVNFVSLVNFVPFGTSILMWTSRLGHPDWDVPKGRASQSGRAGADPPRGTGRHHGRSARPPVCHCACVTSTKVGSQSLGTRPA
jgi:hypothetical protein